MAGFGAKRPAGDDRGLAIADGMFVERGFGQIQCTPARFLKPNLSAP